jgi:hypothetical protein
VLEDYLNRRYLERNLAWAAACDPSLVASRVFQQGVVDKSGGQQQYRDRYETALQTVLAVAVIFVAPGITTPARA